MSEHEAFISGWQAALKRAVEEIKSSTVGWNENGPSMITVGFILGRLGKIPTPVPEESNG